MNSVAIVVNSDFCLCTINSCDFTVHALKKKKKKKRLKLKRTKHAIQMGTMLLLVSYMAFKCHII